MSVDNPSLRPIGENERKFDVARRFNDLMYRATTEAGVIEPPFRLIEMDATSFYSDSYSYRQPNGLVIATHRQAEESYIPENYPDQDQEVDTLLLRERGGDMNGWGLRYNMYQDRRVTCTLERYGVPAEALLRGMNTGSQANLDGSELGWDGRTVTNSQELAELEDFISRCLRGEVDPTIFAFINEVPEYFDISNIEECCFRK